MALQQISIPDLGGAAEVEIVEILVAGGDSVAADQPVAVLETDKASVEIASEYAGVLTTWNVAVGDSVGEGAVVALVDTGESKELNDEDLTHSERQETDSDNAGPAAGSSDPISFETKPAVAAEPPSAPVSTPSKQRVGAAVYAGPSVRKLARQLGISLETIDGTGPRKRILAEDVHSFLKARVQADPAQLVSGIPPVKSVDYQQFGDIVLEPRSRLDRLTADNMSASWLNVPRVTQFDDADITELDAFRTSLKPEAERRGVPLTPLAFIVSACAVALARHPAFNASLSADGSQRVIRQYIHIGIAVDTSAGLVVPVIRDADKKTVWTLAAEIQELANRSRDRKLRPEEMQGGGFTVSSLGNLGGRGFTPIVNSPELAILGVGKASIKPCWNGEQFEPRKMLPLSLGYDHRAINGAAGGRFMSELVTILSDLRQALL